MLVFTRKLDEAIVIGDGIEIKILRIGRDGVRIGVTAASHVPVHRLEVYDQIRATNASSAGNSGSAHDLALRLRQHVSDKETGFPPGNTETRFPDADNPSAETRSRPSTETRPDTKTPVF